MENQIKKEIKFIALYARVSTSNQEDQKTIDAQLSEDREFAKKSGYIIVKEYLDEGWSGDIIARPSLDQLRHDARNRTFDAVLAYDPDRLGRKLVYQEIVIDELKKIGIEILFVTMPPVNNASDKLLFGVRGLFAEYEKAKIAERFRIGKVNRVKNKQVLTTEAPYGYTYILNKGKRGNTDYVSGHYEINEREAEIIKNIFHWVADDGLTLRAVVRKLQELGIKPRKSKRGVWNTSTLSTLLRHEAYIGTTYWGASYATVPINPTKNEKYKKVEKSSRRMKSKDQWYAIPIPALIEKDLFERAGLRLKKNFATLGRNTKNHYLLASKIWCMCGQRRAGEGPQKGKHLYYRCTDRVHSFPLPPSCVEGGINAKITDKVVWDRLKMIMSSPELLTEQIKKWKEKNNANTSINSTINIESTQNEIIKIQGQESRFAVAYSKEVISLKQFEEFVAPLRDKIHDFEIQIAQANLEKTPKNEILFPSSDEIEVFAKEATECLKNLSFQLKQAFIRTVVNQATASRKSLQVYGLININEIYVKFFSEYRNCRSAKCREIDPF
ncbi:MAG: recombinase family protein [Candidatus Paceibacterota bacterium]